MLHKAVADTVATERRGNTRKMRWFRTRARYGAYAALLALLVQGILSFGHLHARNLGRQTTPAALANTEPGKAITSGDQRSHDPAGHVCDICATLSMIGSAQVAAPPALPLPIVFSTAAPALPAQVALAEPRRAHFRSRLTSLAGPRSPCEAVPASSDPRRATARRSPDQPRRLA
jgi:hypothetical protein